MTPSLQRCFLSLTIICMALAATGQSGYELNSFFFRYGGNSKLFKTYSDNPGAILIDGYLKGKLRAYKSDIVSEVVKRGPIDTLEIPYLWEKGVDYYMMDRVAYDGHYYEAVDDVIASVQTPDNDKRWLRYYIEGVPVSTKRTYPTVADTLSKAEFLARMVSQIPSPYRPWDVGGFYYAGEIVNFRGWAYMAGKDVTSFKPPNEDGVNWDIYGSAAPEFFSSRDVSGLQVLTHREISQGKRHYTPQVASPVAMNYNTESNSVLAFFDYADAVNYLNTIGLPVLFDSPLGYLTQGQFVLDLDARAALLESIKKSVKAKSLKIPEKMIRDKEVMTRFLNDTTRIVNTPEWTACQDLNTGDLILGQQVFSDEAVNARSFAAIPFKTLEKAMLLKPAAWHTAWDGMANPERWESMVDTLFIDSLSPKIPHLNPHKTASSFLMVEEYFANADALNPNIATALPEAWKLMNAAFYAKRLKFKVPFITFFPWQYDWSTIKPTAELAGWTFSKDFTLGAPNSFQLDSLESPQDFKTLSVTYKKIIPTDSRGKFSFVPFEITVEMSSKRDPSMPVRYTTDWRSFKELLSAQASQPLAQMLQGIERGTLSFYRAEIITGPLENK